MYLLFNHCYDPGNEPPNYILLGPFPERDYSVIPDLLASADIPNHAIIGWFERVEDVLMGQDHYERVPPEKWFMARADYLEAHLEDFRRRRAPAMLTRSRWISPVSQEKIDLEIDEQQERICQVRRRLFKYL